MILLQELASDTEAFQWFDKVSFKFLSRFLVDIVAVFILVRFIYFRHYRRTDLFLTFFGFNIIIFLITYLLNKVEMSMGGGIRPFCSFLYAQIPHRKHISQRHDLFVFLNCLGPYNSHQQRFLGRPRHHVLNTFGTYSLTRRWLADEKREYQNH